MAERTPLYMDINNVYSGDEMGLPNRDFISEGVVLATDMAVTAGAGNTINIAAGACWVVGDTDIVNQPTYRIINDAVVNLGINPDPTNPRIVRVGMQINDAGFSGVLRNGVLTAIHGTPAVSPATPAEPSSFLTLATVFVPAAAASSAAYTFTDARPRARVGSGQAVGSGLVLLWDSGDAGVTLPAASITTPTLPQTYKHLHVNVMARSAGVDDFVVVRFNGDTGANYDSEALKVVGTTVTGIEAVGGTGARCSTLAASTSPAGESGIGEFVILNYADATKRKGLVGKSFYKNADTTGNFNLFNHGAGWRNTAAITSMTFLVFGGSNIAAPARISVYGEA